MVWLFSKLVIMRLKLSEPFFSLTLFPMLRSTDTRPAPTVRTATSTVAGLMDTVRMRTPFRAICCCLSALSS